MRNRSMALVVRNKKVLMVQAIRFMRFGISKRIFRNIPVTYSAVSVNENLI